MKSRVALIAVAMLASTVALAQHHDGRRGPDMDRMAVLLDLNADQKAQVASVSAAISANRPNNPLRQWYGCFACS